MTDKRKSDRLLETGGGLDLLANISGMDEIDFVGRELGDYRITGLIGAGGMGKVYRAKRIDGSFEREVAIKIAPVGGFDEDMRRRFLREQRLLAELIHPNISRLYDAQVTEQQWPYIVMELVDGRPIDRYCEEAGLGLDDRVRLLIQVAEAVAYANARLIVHRDIKPANVLVDREGTPKLLDFGIARLISGDMDVHTRTLAMTPGYASPEQLLGRQANVASDVYQLGLLIHATLTGQSISGGDTLNDAIERAAAGRSLQIPASSRSELPRELVLVIEQCLRPDPDDRYPDANALKDDLKAFLAGFPVRAAGMGPAYRFRKLVGRNRPMAAVVALALISIVGSTIWYTRAVGLERDEALRQTRMADASLDFLLDVFEAAAPENAQGREISATELLDQGAARAAGETINEPAVRARVLLSLGSVYKSLEQLDKAQSMVLQGLEVSEAEFGADSAMHLRLQGILGNIHREKGDLAVATPLLEHVLERTRALFGPDDELTLGARANLASSYLDEGRLDEALGMIREIYGQREARDPEAESTLRSAVALVNVLHRLGRHEEAIDVGTEALARADAALGENHPVSMSLLNNMAASVYVVRGIGEALPYNEDVLARHRVVYGPDDFRTLRKQAFVGAMYGELGELEKSEALQRTAIEKMIAIRGPDNVRILTAQSNHASTLITMGRTEDALEILPGLVQRLEKTRGLENPATFYTQLIYAKALIESDAPGAVDYALELRERFAGTLGEEHHWYGELVELLPAALQGKPETAASSD
ncbi:protein kinase domain-containing protein [Lentisalinibacter orientalis]|uniref:protein kinase domain-containing protein n=1 Tax=Lentisalinibacter orientalis TaxID=2992241 RepID=UPI00387000E6